VLCDEVLGVREAYLVPLGPLASLLGRSLAYPGNRELPRHALTEIAARLESPQTMYVRLDPGEDGGAAWAVPLWSERGLIGALLLGEKRDGGLYAEEEIEVARASGERLFDTMAAVETARRLMSLLRQRIAQVRVMEGQGRRVLHDHVLPQLHAAILYLNGVRDDLPVTRAVEALTAAHRQISDLMRDAAPATPQQLAEKGLIAALRTLVEEDFREEFARVSWHISPDAEACARQLPVFASEVIFFAVQELIRNAARHGRDRETGRPLHLRITSQVEEGLRLAVEDDGIGFASETLSFPGESAGRGQGLRFHSTMLAALGARMEVMALPEDGTRGLIVVPSEAIRGLSA
jgi:signal transduction histidine kinase